MHFDPAELVEITSDPAFLITAHGRIVAANGPAARAIGVDKVSLAHSLINDICNDPPEVISRYLLLSSRTREPLPGSINLCAANGESCEMGCEGRLLRPRTADEPAVLFLVCRRKEEAAERFTLLNEKIAALSREIAERRRAESERDAVLASERAARTQAERANRMKDEFLATLSHELRTPLNAILGWSQLLAMGTPSEEDIKEGLDVIQRNTRMQSQLIDDLLDMSRIIAGKVRLDVQRVQLASIIEAAIASISPAIEAKGIRLHKVLDPLTDVVSGDPNRLQQVFFNLLSNAVKFTPKGGRIQVLLERVNSHVEVSVIDTGSGIKPEFLPYVFDRFQQADSTTTRQHGGLGLGLAISKHLVELHGGVIRAKSPGLGRGATFVVQLPLMIIHDEKEVTRLHPTTSGETATECPPGVKGLKVLVVDDEPDAVSMMRRVLEFCECEVITADNALEAFNLLKQHRPDVLISDIGMPGEDGYALLARIRALPAEDGGNTPAIAVTAFARSDDRRRAMLAGFQMHMAKPVETAELVAVVANVASIRINRQA